VCAKRQAVLQPVRDSGRVMISVSIRIQHPHCTRSTSTSVHPNSTRGWNLHFAESIEVL